MSVKEIQRELAAMPADKQDQVTAFLFNLRHKEDKDYQRVVSQRLSDTDSENWLSPEEFEKSCDRSAGK